MPERNELTGDMGTQGSTREGNGGRPLSRRASITLATVTAILSLVVAFFGGRYLLNARFLGSYDNGTYNASIPVTLTYLNFPDPYLPYHNLGCAAFMMGNYEYAASAFQTALEHDIPHDDPHPSRECQTRINLALSLTRPLDIDGWGTEEERQQIVQTLLQARESLTADGCANPDKNVFDGHSEEAEQLKKDIDAALEKLSDPNSGDDGDDGDDNSQEQQEQGDDQGGGDQEQQNEDRLKDRLNDRKSNAMQDRAEEQKDMQDLTSEGGLFGGSDEGGEQEGAGSRRKTW